MVAAHSTDSDTRALDALLSAMVPGAGQLNQRRYADALHFLLDALLLLAVMTTGVRALSIAGFIGLLAVAGWSVVDAYRGGRAR
jgi:hypothetical protein